MLRALEATTPIWEVPFDAGDPVNTPRNLNENNPEVVQAMCDALAHLAGRGRRADARRGGGSRSPVTRAPRRSGSEAATGSSATPT